MVLGLVVLQRRLVLLLLRARAGYDGSLPFWVLLLLGCTGEKARLQSLLFGCDCDVKWCERS